LALWNDHLLYFFFGPRTCPILFQQFRFKPVPAENPIQRFSPM
jgi:hypothetical protein